MRKTKHRFFRKNKQLKKTKRIKHKRKKSVKNYKKLKYHSKKLKYHSKKLKYHSKKMKGGKPSLNEILSKYSFMCKYDNIRGLYLYPDLNYEININGLDFREFTLEVRKKIGITIYTPQERTKLEQKVRKGVEDFTLEETKELERIKLDITNYEYIIEVIKVIKKQESKQESEQESKQESKQESEQESKQESKQESEFYIFTSHNYYKIKVNHNTVDETVQLNYIEAYNPSTNFFNSKFITISENYNIDTNKIILIGILCRKLANFRIKFNSPRRGGNSVRAIDIPNSFNYEDIENNIYEHTRIYIYYHVKTNEYELLYINMYKKDYLWQDINLDYYPKMIRIVKINSYIFNINKKPTENIQDVFIYNDTKSNQRTYDLKDNIGKFEQVLSLIKNNDPNKIANITSILDSEP